MRDFTNPRFLLPRASLWLCAFLFAGCQPAMSTSAMSSSASPDGPGGNRSAMNAEWPLKFKAHYFGVATYSTYGCKVLYGGRARAEDAPDKLEMASAEVPNYPNNLKAGWGPIGNFPSPAIVTWRSKDGASHEAEVDIGEIFKDELIRHNLTKDEVTPATLISDHAPGIILEVNDRTINVYMRATLWTKELQIPGNRLSDQRNDLIKVYSRTY